MIRTGVGYTAIYTYDELDTKDITAILWQTTQIFWDEESAIAAVLSYPNVKDMKIIQIPNLPRYVVPDTLNTYKGLTGEIVDYGEASNPEQHAGECDRAQPDPEDREIFSGT